jgi:hypothetical protein
MQLHGQCNDSTPNQKRKNTFHPTLLYCPISISKVNTFNGKIITLPLPIESSHFDSIIRAIMLMHLEWLQMD